MINQINIKYQILILFFFKKISVIIRQQISFIISYVLRMMKSLIHDCHIIQF